MIREQSFSREGDANPYTHLQEFCNNPEISRKPKTTTTKKNSNKTMNGEVSYRKPNLVAQVAPKSVNCILAFK
jgi:hypothetical protein